MSYVAQHNAIRSRFDTQWGSTTTIAWQNAGFEPPANASWVRLHVGDASARQASFGDVTNYYRHVGLVTVMIFAPLNKGDNAAVVLADQAAAIFRGWQDTATKMRFREAPYMRQVGAEEKWYHVNVFAPFERDTLF